MKTIAIIPARSGSKGIPGKNVIDLAGFPLLAYSIAAAKLAGNVDEVIVSTDSQEIAEIAVNFGAKTPFLRPQSISQDKSSDLEFFLHAIDWFQQNTAEKVEYWVHLRPTTPLRDPERISEAVEFIHKHQEATSLRSASLASESPYKWLQKASDETYFEGIRPDDPRPEYFNLPRQSFPEIYVPDGYVDVVRTSFITSNPGLLHGDKLLAYVTPRTIELDTPEDLEQLRLHLQIQGMERYAILDYLTKHYSTHKSPEED
jgi:CMP-N,N'-diacetyllegionaminic acid synthase